MKIEDLTLAEIVTTNPSAAALFENMHLDFCCKGKQKLNEALINDQPKLAVVKGLLEKILEEKNQTEIDFNAFSLSRLIDYIIDNHHRYVKESLPVIQQHLQKVVLKHGDSYPYMKVIAELFDDVKTEFEYHMMKEELILFPKIKRIESGESLQGSVSVQTIINVMEIEHTDAGEAMEKIRNLSNDFTVPENACVTFKVCMQELKMFESDLHKHVHLENNILFPKVIIMQNSGINYPQLSGL